MREALAEVLRRHLVAAAWLNDVSVADFVESAPQEVWSLAVVLWPDAILGNEERNDLLGVIAADVEEHLGRPVRLVEHDLGVQFSRIGQIFDDRMSGRWFAVSEAARRLSETRLAETYDREQTLDALKSLAAAGSWLAMGVDTIKTPGMDRDELREISELLDRVHGLAWLAHNRMQSTGD
ncbi:hypothetical protein [Gryllotalpicola protaetiae]|uniref:Uncharacterized protein n=1 Tax=Gryllotalpicola protaetiae TaxID=2419771 RepID=A0A387BHA8_9MICO|nr:hypothetical protein [Gryllotalpicola protaetiae]AYG03405.1 hypothetical protein D7I44_07570 [Gryllotalpicola protaetiae]